ncbi:MAG: heme-binding protein [Spirochaeta sp.]|nr:heme-binding protein [Spirochaeta sp.]RPG14586.1 MAG: heme-binding protein [Proteobacteria bacterium TMED72]
MATLPASSSRAIEEPDYEIQRQDGKYEIRTYGPRLVAETWVEGTQDDAGSIAFRRLAGYIFGGNAEDESISMTAPVTQEPPAELEASAEVSKMPAEGRYRVTFTMPREYSMETLPAPKDERVVLREEPGRRVASLRYRGFWSTSRYQDHEQKLIDWIEANGLERTPQPPVWARYDPPYMPWFLRRNEIHIELKDVSE